MKLLRILTLNSLYLAALTVPVTFSMTGCDTADGPAEKLGEEIDHAADESHESLDEAAEEVKDEVDDATDDTP
jgi:hypothetical protein